jgi:hypothetical protein
MLLLLPQNPVISVLMRFINVLGTFIEDLPRNPSKKLPSVGTVFIDKGIEQKGATFFL